jgi:hypothetical protein
MACARISSSQRVTALRNAVLVTGSASPRVPRISGGTLPCSFHFFKINVVINPLSTSRSS